MANQFAELTEFFEVAMRLLPDTIADLMENRELNRESWQSALAKYRTVFSLLESAPDNIANSVRAVGDLGSIVAADDLNTIAQVSGKQSDSESPNIVLALREALIAKRKLDLTNPIKAVNFSDLANSIYSLLPYYGDSQDKLRTGLQYVAELYAQGMRFGQQQGDLSECLAIAGSFTGLANELATKFESPHYVEYALNSGEEIVKAESDRPDYSALAVVALCNNLINSCVLLMKSQPENEHLYVDKAFSLSQIFAKNLTVEKSAPAQPELIPVLEERGFTIFIMLHEQLARISPENFIASADSAWEHALKFEAWADGTGDPDQQLRASAVKQRLKQRLQLLHPEWTPNLETQPDDSRPPDDEFSDLLALKQEAADAFIEKVMSTAARGEQEEMIATTFASYYQEITRDLEKILSEIGLNHHGCRLVLALGALASGKLGKLSGQILTRWILHSEDLSSLPPGRRREIMTRQQSPAVTNFACETNLFITIRSLGRISGWLQQDSELEPFVLVQLRERNTRILEHLLPRVAHLQHLEGPVQNVSDDWRKVLAALEPQYIPHVLAGYEPALAEELEARENLFPSRPGDLESLKPNGSSEATDEPVAGEQLSPSEVSALAGSEPSAENEIPDLKMEYDPESLKQIEGKTLETPEAWVGVTLTLNGAPYRIKEVLGTGTRKVVFGLINLEDGTEMALAQFRAQPDLLSSLRAELNEVLRRDLAENPDAIVELCNQVLELDPNDESAAFNKGVIFLMVKKDFPEALKCFDLAVNLAPRDYINWIHKALALAPMDRNSEAVAAIDKATKIAPRESLSFCQQFTMHQTTLKESADRFLEQHPEREDVRQLIETYLLA